MPCTGCASLCCIHSGALCKRFNNTDYQYTTKVYNVSKQVPVAVEPYYDGGAGMHCNSSHLRGVRGTPLETREECVLAAQYINYSRTIINYDAAYAHIPGGCAINTAQARACACTATIVSPHSHPRPEPVHVAARRPHLVDWYRYRVWGLG